MNTIRKISLTQFRNYNSASFDFTAPVTCVTGPNGSGKTNLLDAIYYLCYTKSYFSATQQHNVQHGMDGFRLEGDFCRPGERSEVISCRWRAGKKEVALNGKEYERMTDHIGKYAAVMIAPDDVELINGFSEQRRRWLDGILGQVDKAYLEALMQYQRILLQRNAWLKLYVSSGRGGNDELDYYDAQLSLHGAYIFGKRERFAASFVPLLNDLYTLLSGGKEIVSLAYRSDLAQDELLPLLKNGLQHDLRMQRTLRGIHRDDLDFSLNDTDLKQFASQGQKKSYLFALKLAQYGYLSQEMGHLPILLLDDVFEKLDQHRMESLLGIITADNFGQVILTDTHRERVQNAFGHGAQTAFIELGNPYGAS